MNGGGHPLATLAGFFAVVSLFAIGGGNSAVPEMHRFAVDVQHWLTDQQFADTFALAQLAPGPNLIIVTLIGYHVAGILGGIVATLAMIGPTGVFAYFVGQTFDRFRGAAWHRALAAGLVPVTLGLIAASAAVIAGTVGFGLVAAGVALAAALVSFFLRINPLWVFGAAAVLGLSGFM